MARHRKHSFGVHAAGAKAKGSCFSRVGIPVLIVLVFAGLLTLYIRMGTNMARGKGTIRSAAAATGLHLDGVHDPVLKYVKGAVNAAGGGQSSLASIPSQPVVKYHLEPQKSTSSSSVAPPRAGGGAESDSNQPSQVLTTTASSPVPDGESGQEGAQQELLSRNEEPTRGSEVENTSPAPSVRFHLDLGAVQGVDHAAKATAHSSALQQAIAKSKARAAKQAAELAAAQAGSAGTDCQEQGWCKFNLKVQADGSPHENCAAWKKDCPCTCAEGQSAPPQRQVDFFNDHSASGFGPDHNAADRAALKQAVAAATSTEAQVYVGEVVIRSEGGDDAPWQEIPIPEAGGDPSLDPQLRVNAKYPGDVETEEERALRENPRDRVALAAVQTGALPDFLDYVAESALWNEDLVDFFVFHVVDSDGDGKEKDQVEQRQTVRGNFFVVRLTWEALIERFYVALERGAKLMNPNAPGPCWSDHDTPEEVKKVLLSSIRAQSASVFGSKVNDLKVLFGGMFPDYLRGYSHWGWFDTDIIFGDLSSVLRRYLPDTDIITFPDGVLNALYLGGQLTVFRNNAYFRACFVAETKLPGQYLCMKGNRLSDEKFALYHAVRSKRARAVFDGTQQFSGTGRGHHAPFKNYEWVMGHLYRPRHSKKDNSFYNQNVAKSLASLEEGKVNYDKHTCVSYWDDWSFVCLDGPTAYSVYRYEWPKLSASYAPRLPTVTLGAAAALSGTVGAPAPPQPFEEAGFLHVFDWKAAMAYFIGHKGADHARAFEVKKDDVGLTIHATSYHVAEGVVVEHDDRGSGGSGLAGERSEDAAAELALEAAAAADPEEVQQEEIELQREKEKAAADALAKAAAAKAKEEAELKRIAGEEARGGGAAKESAAAPSSWRLIAPNVPPVYTPSEPRTPNEAKDENYLYKREIYAIDNGEGWSWANGRSELSSSTPAGIAGIPGAPSSIEQIPRIAHFVITDSSTRYFDWTCYLAVMAARHHVKPKKIFMHVLHGATPKGPWYEALLTMPEFEVVPFGPDDIPKELNNHAVTHPAHMSDFRRMQVLLEHGGIYFDTDHVLLRPLDELLRFREVFGRQGKNERGYQVAVGFMMAAQGSDVIRRMIDLMQEKFDGGWVSHSVNMVDAFFDQRKYAAAAAPPCDECLVLPYGALFPFSWNRKDLCCDYYYHEGKPATSLFGGTGFRWDAQYSVHLFHSQSERMTRYYGTQLRSALVAGEGHEERGDSLDAFFNVENFAVAVRMAIGQEGLRELVSHADDNNPASWANYDGAVKEGWVEDPKKK